jgi:thiamine kinase-like enzyme
VREDGAVTDGGAAPALRAALESLLDPDAAARAVFAPLEGGLNRRSYLVTAGAKQWVLRLPTPHAEALLDLATEASVMSAAAAAGLAPAVAGVDLAHGALLVEYRAGARPWTAVDARAGANLPRVAVLLRKLHALAVPLTEYRAESIARKYLAALSAGVDAQRARFDARSRKRADELLELAREYDAAHAPTALCHNDLVAANVLDGGGPVLDGSGLVLVDFEYAVRAAPVLDLAGLAGMNDYGRRECRDLLAAYYDGARVAVSADELARVVRMVRLVAFFWARVGELGVAASEPYARLARELDRRLK